jgi:hypothetical protein
LIVDVSIALLNVAVMTLLPGFANPVATEVAPLAGTVEVMVAGGSPATSEPLPAQPAQTSPAAISVIKPKPDGRIFIVSSWPWPFLCYRYAKT